MKYQWKDRKGMIKRGKRLLEAHWRNRLEACQLDEWFFKNVASYCAVRTGKNIKPSDVRKMNDRFWLDCSKELMPL